MKYTIYYTERVVYCPVEIEAVDAEDAENSFIDMLNDGKVPIAKQTSAIDVTLDGDSGVQPLEGNDELPA